MAARRLRRDWTRMSITSPSSSTARHRYCCRPKAHPLGLIRRHFLFEGDNDGIGRLRTVELLVRHAVQLFRREMHVVMQVLVLFGSG